MPTLALRNEEDIRRLQKTAETPFEKDLVETLVDLRCKYIMCVQLIQRTANVILDDLEGKL